SFHQSLLAAAVALVVGGSALAQGSPMQEAVNLLRLNNKADATTKLQEIINADPSNEAAHDLYQSISQDEWYMLMTEAGEISKIARSILDRAKTTQRERSRDEDAINALVKTATDGSNDYGTRQAAVNTLVSAHGEFAVPALVAILGDADNSDGQIHAISVLSQLHSVAVLPLIEALKSSNDLAVQNACAALHLIGDARALPILTHLANDDRVNISTIAGKFVAKKGAAGDALSQMLAQSNSYLRGNVPVGGFSKVVWTLVDDKLVSTDVPALLYPTELAKSAASDAARIAPASVDARSAVVAANLAQSNLIGTSIAAGDDSVAGMEGVAAELRIAALASGTDAMRGALDAAVKSGIAPVAIEAIAIMSEQGVLSDKTTLLAALQSTDKRIKYAAAEAMVRSSTGSDVPMLTSVVDVLAQAVTEEKVNTIHMIMPDAASRAVAKVCSAERSIVYATDATAVAGTLTLMGNPSIDVVVINEILPDALPEDVIGNIRKDGRMDNAKIIMVTKDEEAASERFGDDVTFIIAPLSAESLQAAVAAALEGAENPGNARAEGYASKASAALLSLAGRKADIGGAMANLALQLNRGDSVSVPAAKAIGISGTEAQLTALIGALENGSDDLKKASARAIGNVLSRMSTCPDNVYAALSAAYDANPDLALRTAIASALGMAKVDAQKHQEMRKKLRRVAGSSNEG
ncbi:MAG: HEAT repeat protein, partial [Planctomycetota bacterium]